MNILLCLLLALTSLSAFAAVPQPRGRDNAPMVLIPAGPFIMGSDREGEPDERPRRTVTLPAYWMDVREVTNAQYKAFCDATGHKPPPNWRIPGYLDGKDNWPVVNVTWEDAAAYAKWAGKRLPTEAEWEKAARGTDGRAFPWGDEEDKSRAALDEDLGAVGKRPAGASPYGCLDMAGNVWEWTSDWYDAYPGAESAGIEMVGPLAYSHRSIHYGKKYKVVRGGGALYYYGASNTGRCADRARMLPFAGYDGTGFRCAMDADGAPPRPFDTDISAAYTPAPPRVKPLKPLLKSPVVLTVTEPAGVARTKEIVTSGIPFPMGALRSADSVRLVDETGKEIPLGTRVTGTWRDGSIQWLLLDFACTVAANQTRRFRLHWSGKVSYERAISSIERHIETEDGKPLPEVRVAAEGKSLRPVPGPGGRNGAPDAFATFVRAAFNDIVTFRDAANKPLFRLDRRETVLNDALATALTLTQISDKPLLPLTSWEVPLPLPGVRSVLFGGDTGAHRLPVGPNDRLELSQESDPRYVVRRNGQEVASGTRAPGWMTVYDGRRSFTVAVRDFWQQFPMALRVDRSGIALRLVTEKEPFEADRGIAKTIEFFEREGRRGDTGEKAARAFQQPLFAVAPPAWYCGSGALGELEPYSLDRFPEYETPVEADIVLWARNRLHGFRHWGDAYMGGPHKGKNAYSNLEYDVVYNHLLQFARTGSRKYLETAIAGARHQSDIDTNHVTGQPWKHSPRHTETPAELGHVFLRGLIAYTHLTGDPRGLETARRIGNWLNTAIRDRSELGNERQIGWGLYALTGIYAATWDKSHLDAARELVDRLGREQLPTGQLNLRWDNRISFFNGLTFSGLKAYYEATGDESVPPVLLKLVDRTLGFYPEYAGRTLDGLCWAYDRTGDRRYRTLIARTWESTQEFAAAFSWGPGATLFSTRYLPYLVRHGMAANPQRPLPLGPDQLAAENGLYRTRLETAQGTLLLRDDRGEPFDLVAFRQVGITEGKVTVAEGDRPLAAADLPATAAAMTRQALSVAAGPPGRVLTVSVEGEHTKGWDLVTTRALPRVVAANADFAGIHRLVPRLYFRADGPALKAVFEAKGEGFYGAVLYDPAGRAVAATKRFVDLGDENAHRYELTAQIPPSGRGKIWSLDIQAGRLLSLDGAPPLFATSRAAFFVPEGAAPGPPADRR